MDTEYNDKGLDVLQLKAVAACGQSNGYLKKWAIDKLEEIKTRAESSSHKVKLPSSIK